MSIKSSDNEICRMDALTLARRIKARNLSFQSSFKHNDVQVVVHGNTGIVTGLSKTNVVYKGNATSGSRKFVNVFVKENGRWLCVVHFEAPVAQ